MQTSICYTVTLAGNGCQPVNMKPLKNYTFIVISTVTKCNGEIPYP